MPKRYLVTGGAGFVGSHMVARLLDEAADVTVLDDLSTGHRNAVLPGAKLVEAALTDKEIVEQTVAGGHWDTVFHFAALSLVGESMRDPLRYIAENVAAGVALIDACVRHRVRRFVLSSTAALFGAPERIPIDEDCSISPGSAYGESKAMLERALFWADRVHGLRSACLRYFNAAGADPQGRLGEDHDPETHLMPLTVDAALQRRPPLTVFGADYPTPDGTCIRDYVHVTDLADAHLRVLPLLDHTSVRFNLGTGRGHSVREVIRSVERVGGHSVPHCLAERRAGDPAILVASPARMMEATGWQPRYTDLEEIVATTWAWREKHPHGYRESAPEKKPEPP